MGRHHLERVHVLVRRPLAARHLSNHAIKPLTLRARHLALQPYSYSGSTVRALKLMADHGSTTHVESEVARANKIHDQRLKHMSASDAALQGL